MCIPRLLPCPIYPCVCFSKTLTRALYPCLFPPIRMAVVVTGSSIVFWWENCGSWTHQPGISLTICAHIPFVFLVGSSDWWNHCVGSWQFLDASLPKLTDLFIHMPISLFFVVGGSDTKLFFGWDNGDFLMHKFRSSLTHSYVWPDAFIHESMRHSPPTFRWYNINDPPLPSRHTQTTSV